jgi:hypothetical protein
MNITSSILNQEGCYKWGMYLVEEKTYRYTNFDDKIFWQRIALKILKRKLELCKLDLGKNGDDGVQLYLTHD